MGAGSHKRAAKKWDTRKSEGLSPPFLAGTSVEISPRGGGTKRGKGGVETGNSSLLATSNMGPPHLWGKEFLRDLRRRQEADGYCPVYILRRVVSLIIQHAKLLKTGKKLPKKLAPQDESPT